MNLNKYMAKKYFGFNALHPSTRDYGTIWGMICKGNLIQFKEQWC